MAIQNYFCILIAFRGTTAFSEELPSIDTNHSFSFLFACILCLLASLLILFICFLFEFVIQLFVVSVVHLVKGHHVLILNLILFVSRFFLFPAIIFLFSCALLIVLLPIFSVVQMKNLKRLFLM